MFVRKGILKDTEKRDEAKVRAGLALCLVYDCPPNFLTRATKRSFEADKGFQYVFVEAMRQASPADRADAMRLIKAENDRQNAVIERTVQRNPVLLLVNEPN